MTDIELLEQSQVRHKELSTCIEQMKKILATKELIEDEKHRIRIIIDVEHASADMTEAFEQEALETYVNLELDNNLRIVRDKLESFNITVPDRLTKAKDKIEEVVEQNNDVIKRADDVIKEVESVIKESTSSIRESLRESEKPEVAPVQQKKITGKDILSDEKLKQMYFKQGKNVKQIAEETGLGAAGLYKRLEYLKKQISDAAKECARQEN